MPKFRKRPVVIEAEQYHPGQKVRGVHEGAHAGCEVAGTHVHTIEGPLHVSPGDWIITGIQGEQYPCKPDVFVQTYEPVE